MAIISENLYNIIPGILIGTFGYAIGEIINFICNIRENTEHIRDSIEKSED